MEENVGKEVIKTGNEITRNFMNSYFQNHGENIKANAQKNTDEFLEMIEAGLSAQTPDPQFDNLVKENLDSPEFAKTFEQAIKTSAQTTDSTKKSVLASLILTRLYGKTETTEALIMKSACEKIEYLNFNQLSILGYVAAIRRAKLDLNFNDLDPRFDPDLLSRLLLERYRPYYPLQIDQLDLEHLESLGCCQINYGISVTLAYTIAPPLFSSYHQGNNFFNTRLWSKMITDWTEKNLQHIYPSTIGDMIGIHVASILAAPGQE